MPIRRVELDYASQGKVLEDYYYDNSRVSLIMGPLGSGKTTQTCHKIFKRICEQAPNPEGVRPSRWLVIRNTYADLLGTTAKDWLELYGDLGLMKHGSKEPPTQTLSFSLDDKTKVQAEIIFMALDREEHVRKLRGYQLTGIWLSEAKELSKGVIDMADGRHGRYPSMSAGGVLPSWHGMLGDTNPPDDEHWYYKAAENDAWAYDSNGNLHPHLQEFGSVENIPDAFRWRFFRQAGGVIDMGNGQFAENPRAENLNNLPKAYYSSMMANKSTDWIKVNLANEYGFSLDGKAVYPEYVDSIHTAEAAYNSALPLHIGMDFGLTPAAVFAQRLPFGQVRVLSEIVSERLGARNFAAAIKAHLAENYPNATLSTITGDPAGNQASQVDEELTVFKVLEAEGIVARPASSNDFTIRRESVAKMLGSMVDGKPMLLIDKKCSSLRKAMAGGYYFKRVHVSGERYHDKPDKGKYSHVAEALQYLCLGMGIGREVILRPEGLRVPRPAVADTDYSIFG